MRGSSWPGSSTPGSSGPGGSWTGRSTPGRQGPPSGGAGEAGASDWLPSSRPACPAPSSSDLRQSMGCKVLATRYKNTNDNTCSTDKLGTIDRRMIAGSSGSDRRGEEGRSSESDRRGRGSTWLGPAGVVKPKVQYRKGPWSPVEDQKLRDFVLRYGHDCWSALPAKAGLQRNGKSCRLRWINYLRPGLNYGMFSREEEETVMNLHAKMGNKWSHIVRHLPGRTDNEEPATLLTSRVGENAMARKRKSQRRDDSSSSDASSSDSRSSDASSSNSSSSDSRDLANNSCDEKPSAETTTRSRRTSESHSTIEKRRNTKKIEDKGIEQMLKELKEDTSAMRKQQLKILNKINNETRKIRKELKKLRKHLVGSSGYDSAAAPRSESNEARPPKYQLEFTCKVKPKLSKGENIKTEEHGEAITVALFDEHKKIVETGPLASATVGLVVVDGKFNQHGNIQYNWRRKDFERSIRRPPNMNSAMGDPNQPVESIVSGGVITLKSGVQRHTGAKILYNSGNKKVRLGVRLLSPTTEGRVLEGLSNPFVVRGHDRPTRQNKKQKGPTMQSISSLPIQTQPGETRFHTAVGPSTDSLSTDQNTYSPFQYIRQDDPSLLMTASVPQDLTSGVAQPASWTEIYGRTYIHLALSQLAMSGCQLAMSGRHTARAKVKDQETTPTDQGTAPTSSSSRRAPPSLLFVALLVLLLLSS